MSEKTKVYAVVGPTASGKTALSIEIAKRMNGEIISCDSMQIYKRMNIGTAKPTKEEMGDVVHHLIDIVEPCTEFSCADYSILAKEKIDDIVSRNKVPIFCGGTGLYIDHVLNNTSFSDAKRDDEYRAYLEKEIKDGNIEKIYSLLKEIDPISAEAIHPNNTKRVIRALEIYHTTGKTKSRWDAESKKTESVYDSKVICLDFKNREVLYDRINRRVDIMVECGLVDEVKSLYDDKTETLSNSAMQGIGYKEFFPYFEGKCSLEQAIEDVKRLSRNYAKRQLTWFRRHEEYKKIYVDECKSFDDIVNIAEKYFKNN